MIVDDAVVVRGLSRAGSTKSRTSRRRLAAHRARCGRSVLRANPDVVMLDIDMPDLDGLERAAAAAGKKRDLIVIMASTLTRRNAE
jgi:two-component system chemotaxis response regulator CheB